MLSYIINTLLRIIDTCLDIQTFETTIRAKLFPKVHCNHQCHFACSPMQMNVKMDSPL